MPSVFLLHKNNWCHLISFRNKQVFDINVFDSDKQLLRRYVSSGDSDLKLLNNIKIRTKLLQSCLLYCIMWELGCPAVVEKVIFWQRSSYAYHYAP